jgi:hypothetical protein
MTGTCEHCGEDFTIELFHNGFGDNSHAYCEKCGKTAILSGWSKYWPNGVKCTQAEIAQEMENHLKRCECGGRFKQGSSPRCPLCKQALSPDRATEYLERQAPGAKKGWRWQRSWSGLYCAVINGQQVIDNFVDKA